jgi:hypothetical protein
LTISTFIEITRNKVSKLKEASFISRARVYKQYT